MKALWSVCYGAVVTASIHETESAVFKSRRGVEFLIVAFLMLWNKEADILSAFL